MIIPRKRIEDKKKFAISLHSIKYIHFRDLYPTIDRTNYQTCTKVDFKAIEKNSEHKNIQETWGRLKASLTINNEYKSKTGSQYFIDDDDNVYRLSNHWGAVASCEWTREGKGQLAMSIFETGDWEIGVANLKDFQIFRRSVDRRIDAVLNPEWLNQIKVLVPLRDKLLEMKKLPEFQELSDKRKKLIGESFGFFNSELKLYTESVTK